MGRRGFITAAAATAAAATAGAATVTPASAQQGGDPGSPGDIETWFADVSNYDGVRDETGAAEVHVEVGARTIAGPFGFGPAAVRVDPGTRVVWEWNGAGGVHDVAAVDGSFSSQLTDDAGATFAHTFDTEGVYRYACTPHEPLGMKGAIVVGDVAVGDAADDRAAGEPDYGDWFDDVGNYAGTVDARDRQEVAVEVGAMVDGVPFAFEPAAVRVSPGTTVAWSWTGEGGAHDVSAPDGAFRSELVDGADHVFTHTFERAGIHRYVCTPHEPLGMKGAVVVGDPVAPPRAMDGADLALVGSLGGAVMSALFLIPIAELRRGGRRRPPA